MNYERISVTLLPCVSACVCVGCCLTYNAPHTHTERKKWLTLQENRLAVNFPRESLSAMFSRCKATTCQLSYHAIASQYISTPSPPPPACRAPVSIIFSIGQTEFNKKIIRHISIVLHGEISFIHFNGENVNTLVLQSRQADMGKSNKNEHIRQSYPMIQCNMQIGLSCPFYRVTSWQLLLHCDYTILYLSKKRERKKKSQPNNCQRQCKCQSIKWSAQQTDPADFMSNESLIKRVNN